MVKFGDLIIEMIANEERSNAEDVVVTKKVEMGEPSKMKADEKVVEIGSPIRKKRVKMLAKDKKTSEAEAEDMASETVLYFAKPGEDEVLKIEGLDNYQRRLAEMSMVNLNNNFRYSIPRALASWAEFILRANDQAAEVSKLQTEVAQLKKA